MYGSLRQGRGNHGLLRRAKYLGTEEVSIPFVMISLGAFPALVPVQNSTDRHRTVIEVYEVDAGTLESLNRLEGFRGVGSADNFYNRTAVMTKHGEAFIYYIDDDRYARGFNRSAVADGDWVAYTGGPTFNQEKSYDN